jgi:hypothetical protein
MRNLGRVKASGLKNRESFQPSRNFLRLSFIEYILDKAQSKKISASVKALAIEQIVFRVILINIILKTIFQSRGFDAAQIS